MNDQALNHTEKHRYRGDVKDKLRRMWGEFGDCIGRDAQQQWWMTRGGDRNWWLSLTKGEKKEVEWFKYKYVFKYWNELVYSVMGLWVQDLVCAK